MNIHCSRLLYLSAIVVSVPLTSSLRFVCSQQVLTPRRSGLVASLPIALELDVPYPPPPYPCWAGFDGPFSPIGPRGPRPHAARPTHTPWMPLFWPAAAASGVLVGIAVPRRGSLCLVLCVLCFCVCVSVLLCRVRVCSCSYTLVYVIFFSPYVVLCSSTNAAAGGSQPSRAARPAVTYRTIQ